MSHVIARTVLVLVLVVMCTTSGFAQTSLDREIDSLFVIASSGEIIHQDMVEPARDSIAALGAKAVPWLIDKMETKSARERVTIMEILKKIGSPAVPDLLDALHRKDHLIVQRVCGALGDIKDSSAVDGLIEVSNHDVWQVRDQAVGALGKIGSVKGAEVVAAALTDTIGQVRKSAAVAAGKLGLNESIRSLVHLLGDDFYGARLSALHSLLKLDTTEVMTVLADSLNSQTALVGDLGCRILGEYGTDHAMELLLTQVNSPSPDRRAHAAIALIKADPLDNCGFRERYLQPDTDRFVRLKIESALSDYADER